MVSSTYLRPAWTVKRGGPVVPVFYSKDYTASAYAFDTTRKSRWIAESLVADPIPGIILREPDSLTADEIAGVHSRRYVEAVRTGEMPLAGSQGFDWDPGLWTMVCATNGGAVDAALMALASGGVAGSLSSGLHHASLTHGSGFCTFNGLALAANALMTDNPDIRIQIVDLDAHCGGGTHDLLGDQRGIACIDVSVSEFDHYRPFHERWTLDMVNDPAKYLPVIADRLMLAPRADIVLYNAGMDPYQGGRIGRSNGITEEVLEAREHLVFTWAKQRGVPLSFVIAGGYTDRETLVRLHRYTLKAAVL
jgi:acetoin utilization deacetylase AcuC-like enzyme